MLNPLRPFEASVGPHLQEEALGLLFRSLGDEMGLQQVDDLLLSPHQKALRFDKHQGKWTQRSMSISMSSILST